MVVKGYQEALKKLWDGVCDIYVTENVRNETNGRDEPQKVLKLNGEPCRLSFSSVSSTSEVDSAPVIQQTVKLFISSAVDVPAGSQVVVTQKGQTAAYQRSGEPARYSTHQEIVLVPLEKYA